MNKVAKIISYLAFVFAFCCMAIGYAAVQDTLLVSGSVSVKAPDKIYAVVEELSTGQYKLTFLKGQRPDESKTFYEVSMEGYTLEPKNLPPWCDAFSNLYEVAVQGEFEAPQNLAYWFYNCEQLEKIDLSGLDTSEVTDFQYMLYGCSALKKIYFDKGFVCKDGAKTTNMFGGNTNLVGGSGTSFDATKTGGEYARVDGGSEHPGYFTYYKYALVFEANGGLGAPDVLLSDDGSFTIPTDSSAESSEGYPLLGWAATKNAADAEYKSGTTYTINNTAPCCEILYAVYDKPLVVKNASELGEVLASGKDLIIEGGTYTYMEGFATGINITLNNIQCKNYFVASSNSNIVINGLDGKNSNTTPLIDIENGATVTVNDAITGNNGGVVEIGRNATLIINGGTYNRAILVNEGYANSNLTINGGTFTNVKKLKNLVDDVGNVTITGGTFGFDLSDSGYIAEGCTVVDNGNGTWTVVAESSL